MNDTILLVYYFCFFFKVNSISLTEKGREKGGDGGRERRPSEDLTQVSPPKDADEDDVFNRSYGKCEGGYVSLYPVSW